MTTKSINYARQLWIGYCYPNVLASVSLPTCDFWKYSLHSLFFSLGLLTYSAATLWSSQLQDVKYHLNLVLCLDHIPESGLTLPKGKANLTYHPLPFYKCCQPSDSSIQIKDRLRARWLTWHQ
jgi:hypothetical protein